MMGTVLEFRPPPLAPRDPRFIPLPVEMVMLAGVWGSSPLPAGWDAEEKVDGIRAARVDGQLYSREGVPLDIPHIAAELERLERRFGERMMFDGEYQEPGGFLDTLGWLSSRGKRTAAGTFHLFDAVPLEQWRRDVCDEPLTARRHFIRRALDDWQPDHVRAVEARPVATRGDVEALAGRIWRRGGEGLVLKDGASLYRRGRSPAWLKHKRALRLSGIVVDILHQGAAARVEIGGRAVRVAVAPPLRATLAVGMTVSIEAMEWTMTGALRQGRAVAIGKD
jgi:DNA ligase-1